MRKTIGPWKKLTSRIAYKNPWMQIIEDEVIRPDGEPGMYAYTKSPNSVYIVPLTPEKEVYLIKQFRYPTRTWSWEIPAGGGDGQPLLKAAKRELKEETGLTARTWSRLGRMQMQNGFSCEWGYVFLAQQLRLTKSHKMKEEGISELKKVPLHDAIKWIEKGKITDSSSFIALYKTAEKLRKTGDF